MFALVQKKIKIKIKKEGKRKKSHRKSCYLVTCDRSFKDTPVAFVFFLNIK